MAVRIVVLPDVHFLRDLFAATDPDFFLEVELERRVTGAGEEQVLGIHVRSEVRILEVELDGVRAVAVVDQHFRVIVRRDVLLLAERPLVVPPTRDDADLEPVAVREGDVELLRLHLLPDLGRDLGDTLIVEVRAFVAEAVRAVPVGRAVAVRIVVLPERGLDDLHVAAATDPDILLEVELERRVAGTGEEQVLGIHVRSEVGILEVELDGVRAVAVVDQHFRVIVRRDVLLLAERPLVVPPTRDDADLEPVAVREGDVELLRLHLLPDLGRDLGDTLIVEVRAFVAEAVRAVPVGRAVAVRIVVLPDGDLLRLPVSAFGARLVHVLRQQELLAVEGADLTHIAAFEHFLRQGDHDFALALAVEALVSEDHRVAVRIGHFDLADELQVRTVDLKGPAARESRAFRKREAGDAGGANGQRHGGNGRAVRGHDLDHATFGGDAFRSDDADHLVADDFEISDADAVRELDRAGVPETGTVDGHRLAGDHPGREEHLDAQPGLRRLLNRIQQITCCEAAQQGNRQEYA